MFEGACKANCAQLELVASDAEESALIPLTVEEAEAPKSHAIALASRKTENAGRIDIEFSGGRRVSVWGRADRETRIAGVVAHMIGLPTGVRGSLVAVITDMRKRMDSLSAHVQT
jgi:hypothetical protein